MSWFLWVLIGVAIGEARAYFWSRGLKAKLAESEAKVAEFARKELEDIKKAMRGEHP